jgi:putative phage-type endonuclease
MNARAQWLAERKLGLGGSDAAPALGLSPWKSPLELYREKRGEIADTRPTVAMDWGTLLEPVIIEAYRRKTGMQVATGAPICNMIHATLPWMRVNLDARHSNELVGVEAKLASSDEDWGEPGTDQVPSYYIPQAQHGMAVAGLSEMVFAVLFIHRYGLREIQTYKVPRDDELIAMMIEHEGELWQRILDGNPPDPSTPEEIRLRWPTSSGAVREAPIEVVAAVDMLAQARDAKRAAEAKEAEFAAVVQTFMEDAAALTFEGRTIATWKQNKPGTKLDVDALTAAHPALVAEFTKAKPGARPLLIKRG